MKFISQPISMVYLDVASTQLQSIILFKMLAHAYSDYNIRTRLGHQQFFFVV